MRTLDPDQSQDGWEERLMGMIDANSETKRARRSLAVQIPNAFMPLVMEVARKRNLSLTALVRRALMAFVVHDLGLRWADVMKKEPPIVPFGGTVADRRSMQGEGGGSWVIKKLADQ
jgi:hypothetical protein